MKIITVRTINFLNFGICCGLIFFAYYLQEVANLHPCPLCVLERLIFAILSLVFLLMGIHNPQKKGLQIYGIIILFFTLLGMFFAGRHLWLQSQPNALGEICVPGVSYLLKSLPLSQAIKVMFLGSADCAKVNWSFLGLSIPGWTFLFFDVFALVSLSLIKGLFVGNRCAQERNAPST
jgi:protein dithiol:quinone oxidoreductase